MREHRDAARVQDDRNAFFKRRPHRFDERGAAVPEIDIKRFLNGLHVAIHLHPAGEVGAR